MATVKVKQVVKDKNISKRELYATVCYYYQQYTLQDVQNMPARDVNLLIKTARKIEAGRNYNQTQIAAAPHSKKGRNVKKLLEHFEKMRGK